MKNIFILIAFISTFVGGIITKEKFKFDIYDSRGDIHHVNYWNRVVTFEQSNEKIKFNSFNELNDYISDVTAKSSSVIGYQSDLDWLIRQGYVSIEIYPTIDTNNIVTNPNGEALLIYNGPNWTINAQQDTSYQIGYFYLSDDIKITDKINGTKWYGVD